MEKQQYKVNVLTDLDMWGKEETKTLILDYGDLEHLKAEMQGLNKSIWEYETIDKKIIAEDMIRRIISVRKTKPKLKILISEQDLKKLFKNNPNLKHKEDILYYEKGGLKENGTNTSFNKR